MRGLESASLSKTILIIIISYRGRDVCRAGSVVFLSVSRDLLFCYRRCLIKKNEYTRVFFVIRERSVLIFGIVIKTVIIIVLAINKTVIIDNMAKNRVCFVFVLRSLLLLLFNIIVIA